MVRVHPGSPAENTQSHNGLACSVGATDSCKVGAVGSTPTRSTEVMNWGHGPTGRHRYGMAVIAVRFRVDPLKLYGR